MSKENRRFFRIDDSVNLSCRVVSEQQTKLPIQTSSSLLDNCSLTSALERISEETTTIYHRLATIHADFAEYLELLELKIDLIAQAVVVLLNTEEVTEHPTHNVNISVSGMGFDSVEKFEVGQYLEIKMLLAHSTLVIVTYAKVIHCVQFLDNPHYDDYFVGVEYVNMTESNSDLLSKHITKKQLQQIREQKEQEQNV
ncbi:MAG: PilZ domain-containing protein [Methylococcaceae bacterium]